MVLYLSVISAYSRIASRGRTCTDETLAASWWMSVPLGGRPNSSLTRSRAVTSQTRTRLPRREAASASAAESVLLPVPPLPVTTSRRRSRRLIPAGTYCASRVVSNRICAPFLLRFGNCQTVARGVQGRPQATLEIVHVHPREPDIEE